ncbi:ArnT family glycosyltransferase [Flavisolibacter nicotianae]|uniref:ArnT family glycosyltransferase n=1 Tax=Flavisolibacter nicotianae TaxID=2364882 RepID=UPI000EB20DEB|nr:glycosyltransferase family 39 protein [Flavisolibacter nicotianae]
MSQTVSLPAKTWSQRIGEKAGGRPVVFFLLFWLVLNLLQVAFMELTSDEGYYWFYAQHLQWGYYDHPPLVAVMIRLGSFLFPGELGVRFFNVLLSTAALALFFSLLPERIKHTNRTYLVMLSAPLLHYLTFLVFPDGPLLTFSLLFLVVYKQFVKEKNLATSLLLGVSLALMAYAKYHGSLVLLFTVMANPRLLKQGYFYLSLLVAAVLFLPHLWWQYQHAFPTLKYHLSGRTSQWSFRHVGEYVSQQIVAIGPGLIFLPFVCRAKDVFERTLRFIIIGTLLFFLVSSFKTFVHFHWTSIALFPLLYFAVDYYNRPEKTTLFRWLILPFVVLFFLARLLLMIPLIPGMHVGEDVYHGRKAWAKELSIVAGNKPVFMPNNLRESSLYSFYSGKQGVTLYNRPAKKSQYELWGYEDSLQGKDVLLVTKYPFAGSTEWKTAIGQTFFYTTISSFQSFYTGITLKPVLPVVRRADTALHVVLEIENERRWPVNFANGSETTSIICSIEKDNRVIRADAVAVVSGTDPIPAKGSRQKELDIPLKELPKGEYQIYFGIRTGLLPDAILSAPFVIQYR